MTDLDGAPVNMRLAAESYARLGLLVFPLAPRSKTPLTPRGLHDATDDLDQIRAWWSQWPDANIGIACGAMSGLFVVDVDGAEGEAALADLVRAHGALARGPEVLTGKGRHLWFRFYPGARNSASKLGPRIDTRGQGGYVVAPPSLHPSGARYTWAEGSAPDQAWPDVPAWICDALERKPAREASEWSPITPRDSERSRRYCVGALTRTHDELAAAPEGSRNERLRDAAYSLGGYVHTGHLAENEIRDALIDACRANGAWQSEPSKCRDTLERALAAGVSAPRDIPAPRLALVRAAPPAPDYDAPHPAESAEWTQPADDARTPAEVVPMGPPPPPERKWKTTIDLVNAIGDFGEALPVYLPTLDTWTRGGLRRGTLIGIGGAPGAGKTTLALQMGHVYHDQGHPVAIYAADEDRSRLLVRWGQQCGLTREDLESGNRDAIKTLAWHVRNDLVDFVDPGEAGIDEVGAWLLHRSAEVGKIGVLVVDSLQTCRVTDDEGIEPKRRVDRVVGALKTLAGKGLLVIVTSEVARAFYRSQVDRIDPLAAFKESGSIEYALGVGLVLESVKGEVGQTDIYVAKNRLGRTDRHEPALRLRLDFERATLKEIERVDVEEASELSESDEDKIAQVAESIYRGLLMASNPVSTRPGLYDLASAKQRLKVAAVSRLIADGRIAGGRGEPYRAVPQSGVSGDE